MIPWRWGRFLGLTVAGLTPTASQLTKIGKIVSHIELPVKLLDYFLRCNKSNINQPAGCRLCSRARESWFESTNDLADETYATLAMQAEKGLHQFTELPTTSSERTCMTACRLHKNQKSSSSLSRLTKKVNWQESAAKKISKNLQQGTCGCGDEGTENRGDNRSQKNHFRKLTLGQVTR